MDKKIKKSIIVKCDSCGDNMFYSIKKSGLLCPSCGKVKPVEDTNLTKKIPLDDKILQKGKATRNAGGKNAVFKCINCGADITLNDYEVAKRCPYCSSSNVSEFDEDASLLPDKIIKFKIDKTDINSTLKKSLKNKWFLPNMFKANPKPKEVVGLYIPSFTFDANAQSNYSGRLYRYEQDSEGKAYKQTFTVKGAIKTEHYDVVIESSSRVSQMQLNFVMPYRYDQKLDFKPEYLLGYAVERFNNDLSKSKENANNVMQKEIKKKIISKHDADGEIELSITTQYSNECFDYCILPIYIIDFEYKNKIYTAFMNGQTGKTGGNLPKSWVKITFAWILGIALIVAIIMLSMFGGE